MTMGRFFIVGGAGFIGSHFTDALLGAAGAESVTIYDNLSSGREWHFAKHLHNPKFKFVKGDVKDLDALKQAMDGSEVVIHLASNPDIARAATEPDIDFREGTYLTERVLEAMRLTSAKRILVCLGQRRLRRTGDGGSERGLRPLGADFHVWRQQTGRRGPDQFLLPHV